MRKVVLYSLLSLDGVAEEPGDWMLTPPGDGLIDNLRRVIETQDAVLLGRGTFDYWVGHWPQSDFEPFASFINRTPKHVFTSTPPAETWSASTIVSAPAAERVAALKRERGSDIGIHGSITLARSLLSAGLVDELRLVIAPTLAGRGRRLFGVEAAPRRFALAQLDRTTNGYALAHYIAA